MSKPFEEATKELMKDMVKRVTRKLDEDMGFDAYRYTSMSSGGSSGKPKDYDYFGIPLDYPEFPKENGAVWIGCNHEPVDVGFTTSKWVCKKCDKEVQEPETKGKQ